MLRNPKRLTLKVLETKKLFYRKYPYKVACLVDGAYFVARYGANNAVSESMKWETRFGDSKTRFRKLTDHDDLLNFCTAVVKFMDNDNIRIRSEGRHFNLFCLDETTYNDIVNTMKRWVHDTSKPKTATDLKYLLENKAIKVIVDKLPHDKFKYKVVLKSTLKSDQRVRLAGWVSKYPEDELLPSPSTKNWLNEKTRYVQDPFMYVAEDGMRTLVELYLGPNKARTEEFVLRSSLEEA